MSLDTGYIQNPPVASTLNEHHRRVHGLKCEGPVERVGARKGKGGIRKESLSFPDVDCNGAF